MAVSDINELRDLNRDADLRNQIYAAFGKTDQYQLPWQGSYYDNTMQQSVDNIGPINNPTIKNAIRGSNIPGLYEQLYPEQDQVGGVDITGGIVLPNGETWYPNAPGGVQGDSSNQQTEFNPRDMTPDQLMEQLRALGPEVDPVFQALADVNNTIGQSIDERAGYKPPQSSFGHHRHHIDRPGDVYRDISSGFLDQGRETQAANYDALFRTLFPRYFSFVDDATQAKTALDDREANFRGDAQEKINQDINTQYLDADSARKIKLGRQGLWGGSLQFQGDEGLSRAQNDTVLDSAQLVDQGVNSLNAADDALLNSLIDSVNANSTSTAIQGNILNGMDQNLSSAVADTTANVPTEAFDRFIKIFGQSRNKQGQIDGAAAARGQTGVKTPGSSSGSGGGTIYSS